MASWLIWQRGEFMFQKMIISLYNTCLLIYVAGFVLFLFFWPLYSRTTINMGFYFSFNVKTVFPFVHVEMTWLGFIPVFIGLYWFVDIKKKIWKKEAFVQPTESDFGILFDVYNNLWHYQQSYYNILLTCQSNMYWSCKLFFFLFLLKLLSRAKGWGCSLVCWIHESVDTVGRGISFPQSS